MKKWIIFGLVATMLFSGGCSEMFTWPFSLFSELLPIAIKYAPYALMFLEATPDETDHDVMMAQLSPAAMDQYLESPPENHYLPDFLDQEIAKRLQNKKNMKIIAVPLYSYDQLAQVQRWANKQKGQVSIYVTHVDVEDEQALTRIQRSVEDSGAEFAAQGALSQAANKSYISAQQEWEVAEFAIDIR